MVSDFTRLMLGIHHLCRRKDTTPVAAPPGITIGSDRNGTDIIWPAPTLEKAGHALLMGSSGTGKTVLMANTLVNELAAGVNLPQNQRPCVFVVDPKNDLVQLLCQGLSAAAPVLLDEIVYLDPFSPSAFSFNLVRLNLGQTPVDIRAHQLASLVAQVSTAQGAQSHLGTGARQIDVIQHLLLGALTCSDPRAHVILALDSLLERRQGFKRLAAMSDSFRARQFLENAILSEELRSSCASRLRLAFAASEQLERIVTAPSCLQFDELLSPGRIVLVRLGQPTAGLAALQTFWANMLFRLAVEHLLERPSPWNGHHVRVVVDEAQIVAPVLSDLAESLLCTGRSRGISLTTMSQGTTLLAKASDTLVRVILTNASTRIVGRLSAPDAELLARELAPLPGIEEKSGEVRARFVAMATNLLDREFVQLLPGSRRRFRSQEVNMTAWEQAEARYRNKIETSQKRFALPEDTGPRWTLAEAVPSTPARRNAARPIEDNKTPRSRWG